MNTRVRTNTAMRQSRPGTLALAMLFALLLCSAPNLALASDTSPVVRTARLASVEGDVSVLQGDSSTGNPAQRNMPLTEGTRLATGDNGTAEIEFADGSLVRMTPQSSLMLLRLRSGPPGSAETSVGLLNGLIYAEMRASKEVGFRIIAGSDQITPVSNATVRIRLDQPPAEVAVFDGAAHVAGSASGDGAPGYQVDLNAGETVRADGDRAGSRYFLTQTIEHDSWDDWNEEREQNAQNDLASRTSARDGYAGDQGYGWSDLDQNGTWFDTGQGPVWQPFDADASGFDPYGYGAWVYTSGPGYVWSSAYPWGWTPFRCGSWNYWRDFGWGWRPDGNCSLAGWGLSPGRVGRVNRVNLSGVPPGYRRPVPPVPGPGGPVAIHPIVPVHRGPLPTPTPNRAHAFEARQIAGVTALPLRTAGPSYTPRGGSAAGSSLRRDFPVDLASGHPVLGSVTPPEKSRRNANSLATSPPPAPSPISGQQPGAAAGTPGEQTLFSTPYRTSSSTQPARPVYPAHPATGTGRGPANIPAPASEGGGRLPPPATVRSLPPPPVYSRPAPAPSAPAPVRSAPPPAPPPASAPSPAPKK